VTDSKHIGTAGEHLVAYELSRMGITCALVPMGSLGVDILATVDGSKSLAIQVKASKAKNEPHKWAVGKKPNASGSFFFVFVNIWPDHSKRPEFYVVPSEVVVNRVKKWGGSWPTFSLKDYEVKDYLGWGLIKAYFDLREAAD
jgi:hypothetical protein